jgi:hypothetical protein
MLFPSVHRRSLTGLEVGLLVFSLLLVGLLGECYWSDRRAGAAERGGIAGGASSSTVTPAPGGSQVRPAPAVGGSAPGSTQDGTTSPTSDATSPGTTAAPGAASAATPPAAGATPAPGTTPAPGATSAATPPAAGATPAPGTTPAPGATPPPGANSPEGGAPPRVSPPNNGSVLRTDPDATAILFAGPTAPPGSFAFTFGSVDIGKISRAERIAVTNQDLEGPAVVGQVGLVGRSPKDFRITKDGCSGMTVQVGGSCIVEVAFAPLNACYRIAVLTVQSPLGTAVAGLSGTGVDPANPTGCEPPDDSTSSSETSAATTAPPSTQP